MQNIVIKTISADSSYFPAKFREVEKPLKRFYAAGNIELLKHRPCLGIVGSRAATNYGEAVTTDMARTAARGGAAIVSGLALGIDSIAHRTALDNGGPTIAVLPSSLKNIYPSSHYYLAKKILECSGLLISEYMHSLRPMRHHFIERNRLVAALSDVLLVTEASLKSGTRHTVNAALRLSSKIGVVPGDITRPQSEGSNLYIRDGGCDVHPIVSTDDLMTLLGINSGSVAVRPPGDNEYEQAIMSAMLEGPVPVSNLLASTGLAPSVLNVHLTLLEMRGVIEQIGGKWKLV